MSLINEALKRTRDASHQAGPARTMTVDSYRVSSREDTSGVGSRSGLWVSLLVVAIAAAAAVVFAVRLNRNGQRIQQTLTLESASDIKIDFDKSVPRAKPEPVIAPTVTPPVVEAAVPAAAPPNPAPGTGATTTPEPTKFKLQGITSGPGGREAMVNGYTVRVGEEVEGMRVTSIESRTVKLQQGDHEIVLRMP